MPQTCVPPDADDGSPCIGTCRLEAGLAYCVGCLRTLDEIAAWPQLTTLQKIAILGALPQRRAALSPAA